MSEQHDFDAWRAEQAAARKAETVTVFGQDIPVPTSISLDLSMRVDEADADDLDTLTELVGEMYGDGELQRWRDAGCSTQEFAVLLAWGSARGQGQQLDFAEAAQRVADRLAGKAQGPNRAQRRRAKKSGKRSSRS